MNDLIKMVFCIIKALASGRTVEANETACNLLEKLFEMSGEKPPFHPNLSVSKLTAEEWREATKFGKIACIKMVRARTNMGLKESKDLVEAEIPAAAFKERHTDVSSPIYKLSWGMEEFLLGIENRLTEAGDYNSGHVLSNASLKEKMREAANNLSYFRKKHR